MGKRVIEYIKIAFTHLLLQYYHSITSLNSRLASPNNSKETFETEGSSVFSFILRVNVEGLRIQFTLMNV